MIWRTLVLLAVVAVQASVAVIVNPRTGEVGNRDFLKGRTFAPAPPTPAPFNPHGRAYQVREQPQEPVTHTPPAFYIDPRTRRLYPFKWLDRNRIVVPTKWSSNENSLDHISHQTRGIQYSKQHKYIYFYY